MVKIVKSDGKRRLVVSQRIDSFWRIGRWWHQQLSVWPGTKEWLVGRLKSFLNTICELKQANKQSGLVWCSEMAAKRLFQMSLDLCWKLMLMLMLLMVVWWCWMVCRSSKISYYLSRGSRPSPYSSRPPSSISCSGVDALEKQSWQVTNDLNRT